jgi:endo-1,4-beta-D-glucanase Y
MVQTEYTAWKAKYVQNCGSEARVIKSGEETVSEGIAYGMLLSVLAGDQDLFDRLWSYYKSRRNKNGVMNWKTGGCDPTTIWGENGATDAELDAAAALILADKRWGGYQADTTALINIIKTHETTQCNGRTVLKPGDAWGGCDRTNPSYFAPAYYRAFAAYVPQDAAFWSKFVSDSYALLSTNQAGGLPTDWCNGSGAREGDYGWEACRVPWRIAVDYGWSQDPAAVQSLQAIASAGGSIASFKDPNSCFRGGLALTGVTDQAKLDSNVTQWLANVPADDSYYQGTLRVLYLYTAAGLFVLPQ